VNRRLIASSIVAVALVAAVGVVRFDGEPHEPARASVAPQPAPNPVVQENSKPGTTAWRIAHESGPELEGFASRTSVAPGQRVTIYVSSRFPTFSASVFRMGWYGGTQGRLVWSAPGIRGHRQPPASIDPTTRMVEAHWAPTFTVPVGPSWTSGVYLVKLTARTGRASYVPFTVRESAHRAPFVFESSVTTWEAYNGWGGHSLYEGLSPDGLDRLPRYRSTVVSFDRPYETGGGAGDFFAMELPLLSWLEEQGYDIGYATNIDMQEDPGLLAGRRAFLSMGHDEYWSTVMRQRLESALASGTNAAFFGANAIYRHIRLQPSPLGPDRHQVNYRFAKLDPLTRTDPGESTVQWRDPPVRKPEDEVLGAMYECNPVHVDAVVYDPLPWLFDGTGLRIGSRIPGLVGREYDRVFHMPGPGKRMWVLLRSPLMCDKQPSVADMTFMRLPSGAGVFDAATQGYVCAFGGCTTSPPDQRIQRLTRNLLDEYLGKISETYEPPPRPYDIPPPIVLPGTHKQEADRL
jgi:hypothetical protein